MVKKRSPPAAAEIAADCIAVRVRVLNRTLTALYDQALRPLGMTVAQLNVLVLVARLGPLAPGKVARWLNMEKSTLSRNVERLREKGWVRVLAGESGRGQKLEISARGATLLEKALPHWREAQARATEVLGERGVQSIRSAADVVWAQGSRR